MAIPLLRDLDVRGKNVLIREDLNVPLEDGRVANGARIEAALPTIRQCMAAGARVILVSHLGRPRPGAAESGLVAGKPVAEALGDALGCAVRLVDDWKNGVDVGSGDVALLENIRFEAGETANDPELARRLAALCDVFVMDAFGTAHRAHASTVGVARSGSGSLRGAVARRRTECPGAMFSTTRRDRWWRSSAVRRSRRSWPCSRRLPDVADSIIVGGGIANTFLLASGMQIGASLAESDQVDVARRIMSRVEVPLPVDLMTAVAIEAGRPARLRLRGEVGSDEMILDVGPETARRLSDIVAKAGTILFNGPLGVFELDQFGEGTRVLAEAIASADAYSVAGGGDTLAAIAKYGVAEGMSYQSTGGGAFLEYLAGETLPAVAALERRAVLPQCK